MCHHSISTTTTTDSKTIMDLSIIDELALFLRMIRSLVRGSSVYNAAAASSGSHPTTHAKIKRTMISHSEANIHQDIA